MIKRIRLLVHIVLLTALSGTGLTAKSLSEHPIANVPYPEINRLPDKEFEEQDNLFQSGNRGLNVKGRTLIFPSGSTAAYQKAAIWQTFTIMEP